MPYSVGVDAFLSAGAAVHIAFAVIALGVLSIFIRSLPEDENELDAPTYRPGLSFLHIGPFFRRRFDFINSGFRDTGKAIFQFRLLQNQVIVVSGESARRTFFAAKGFDLTEGFKILSGAIPMVRGVTSDLQVKRIAVIHRRLADVQKNPRLNELIPYILADCRDVMERWGSKNSFEPFDKIYELTFQLTVRSLSCIEIAEDASLVARLRVLYDRLDAGTTPATVLLPWLPTPAMIKKLWATKQIYDIITRAINARESGGQWHDDTLQMLLESGEDRLTVVGFILGLITAGARATGTTCSWLFVFLSAYPEWNQKVRQEIVSLLDRFQDTRGKSSEISSLSERLSTIPVEVWEDPNTTPVLDAMIKETLRVAQSNAAMRKNLGPTVYIDGKAVPTGAYVVYPFSDVHLDPQIYADPWTFNPMRPEPQAHLGYVGWGGGNTVCLGRRLAKMEMKLAAAMFVMGFRHQLVDSSGHPLNAAPVPDWNDILFCRPPSGSCSMTYERTDVRL
ncbi:cytochrome P450 [Fistulina hepatica ATCC 64428]|uniref:Cytochrome P450 n=1 Tax=Fistulina hepatica ATCC 64428 TaxID=1128425 RepID=A0A0D7A9C5_9AGAR|nr:cytochrome P450 [Fistulina hepatica ATCC 64428]